MEVLVRRREPVAFLTLGALVVNLVLLVLAVLLGPGPLVAVAAQLSYPAALTGARRGAGRAGRQLRDRSDRPMRGC